MFLYIVYKTNTFFINQILPGGKKESGNYKTVLSALVLAFNNNFIQLRPLQESRNSLVSIKL